MPRLRRVRPYVGGFTRRRRGRGFEFTRMDGSDIDATERERIRVLAIPPAWTDVWIAESDNCHILAVGVDDAGRRQYLYHPAWRQARGLAKFERMRALAVTLPAVRRTIRRDLHQEGLTRARVLAAILRILDSAAPRVGNEEYLMEHGSRGITTLLVRNLRIDADAVTLRFRSKGGITQVLTVEDPDLARCMEELGARSARSRLFVYLDGTGRLRSVTAAEVNDDIRERTGIDATAKDFRTLRGTLAAADELARLGPATSARARRASIRAAIEAAAGVLGNTPAIAKASYIDPTVFERFEDGDVLDRTVAPETALVRLLGG